MKLVLDEKKCIGCMACTKDCVWGAIKGKDGIPYFTGTGCIECGHCIAVCPVEAITDLENEEALLDKNQLGTLPTTEQFTNLIKFRRTIRQFKKEKVNREDLYKIIEGARFLPTARNTQDLSFVIVEDKIEEVRAMAIKQLKVLAADYKNSEDGMMKRFSVLWEKMYDTYFNDRENYKDALFYGAPSIIVVLAKNPLNGGMAISAMELLANTLGLGVLISGFTARGLNNNEEFWKEFGLEKDGSQVVSVLVVGKPDVEYFRTVPRNKAKIIEG